ncbi:MAG: hypothetical protein AUH85_17655 [Chloroflexi bacterium 13_1_40CM_4_68_4]|nr:MAG: hypothetical protein AUH85_17655 [Chloroflexi bacterium 13_1_40CM_4_68_4]
MHRVLAILAAGSATRAGVDKIFADLGGQPVLAWSLAAGMSAGCFDAIVVVAPGEKIRLVEALVRDRTADARGTPNARVVPGGATRTASSWAALDAAPRADIIAIHDAARPFCPPSLFARCVDIALQDGSAVAGLPLADTVRRADEAGAATEEVSREGLWSAQTPQVFRRELLEKARAAVADRSFGDDAATLIAAGMRPKMVLGERRNLKITTFEDLAYARELVAKGLAGYPALQVR